MAFQKATSVSFVGQAFLLPFQGICVWSAGNPASRKHQQPEKSSADCSAPDGFSASHNVALCNLFERFRITYCRHAAVLYAFSPTAGRAGYASAADGGPCGRGAIAFPFL